MTNEYSIDGITLRQRIEAMPEDCILFRSDFPEYHTEFVGSILSELTTEGMLVKIAHGIYAKPRRSKFGVVLPSVDKVVQAIAARDNAEVLPSGMTADFGMECAALPDDNKVVDKILTEKFKYTPHKLGKDERCTVNEFAVANPFGTFVLKVNSHVVALVDGLYYDSWDSGDKKVTKFWRWLWPSFRLP